MRRTAILKDPLFLEHDPGSFHVETPRRLQVIYDQLASASTRLPFIFPPCKFATADDLGLIHTTRHLNRVAATAGRSTTSLDPDTQTSARSFEAACMAAGAVIQGVELVTAGEADNSFALVRPPGHHAEADHAMGFCLFNNVAIGAAYALKHLGAKRVLIVDWDLHHGNGTQHSFYDTDQVLYFSTHQYPHYPGTGGLLEVGQGAGEGFTINVPLSGGQDDQAMAMIFQELLVPIARQYQPDLILLSAGFDIYYGDPLGGLAVSIEGFGRLARIMVDLAGEICDGRLVATLEGGYNLTGLAGGVMAVLEVFAGAATGANASIGDGAKPKIIEQVRNIAKRYWKL